MKFTKNKLILIFLLLFLTFLLLIFNINVKRFDTNIFSEIEKINSHAEFREKSNNLTSPPNKWMILQANEKITSEKISNFLNHSKDYKILLINNNKEKIFYQNKNLFLQDPLGSNWASNKNKCYLNAIKSGAEYIYDTSFELNLRHDLDDTFFYNDYNYYGLILEKGATPKIFDIHAYFGKSSNRHKIELNESVAVHNNFICGKRKTSLIQHALFDEKSKTTENTFPSVELPKDTYALFNSVNTFYHYEAFWALYLPQTVEYSQSDLIRSLWSQKLLWLIDGTVSFHGVNSYRELNLDVEVDKSFLDDLAKFLFKWKCSWNKFFKCIIELSEQMAKNNFWANQEVDYIKKWLSELKNIGYKEPELVESNSREYSIQTSKEFDQNVYDFYKVQYNPKFVNSEKLANFKYLEAFCKLSNTNLQFKQENVNQSSKKSEMSLVISFNWQPIAQNIEIISAVYGPFFKHIVFCGPNMMNKIETLKYLDSTSFIELNTIKGEFHYYCMTKAIELNLDCKGYLFMSDDVLLKYWKLETFDLNKIWFPFELDCSKSYELNPNYVHHQQWGWWKSEIGLSALLNVWKYFSLMQKNNASQNELRIVENFLKFIKLNSGPGAKVTKVCADFVSDIFYLPRAHFESFHFISEIFRKHRVYVEIAVSTMLAGLDYFKNIELLPGTYRCCGQFGMHLYKDMGVFGHAAKISKYNASQEGKKFCELFVQEIIDFQK